MIYELTKYGEEYLGTLPNRLEKEHAKRMSIYPAEYMKPPTSSWYKLSRRHFLLDKIERGEDPSTWSDTSIANKIYPGKSRIAKEADRKELALMLKENLIRIAKI